jgi:hypothetical protein
MVTAKNTLVLALCTALLIISATFILLTTAGDGHPAVAESDTVLYFQYAKNIAQGHPYVFSPGDAPSTGSTTHLFPFILAILYRLGATGDAFTAAAFALNSLFYLGIVVLVWLITKRLAPKMTPLTTFLTVLSGHTVSAVLKMTDIGFFSFLALAVFTAFVYRKYGWLLFLSILCALSRPEGFIFAIAFALCGTASLILNEKKNQPRTIHNRDEIKLLFCSAIAAATFVATLGINHVLTGHMQFMSVANKGYLNICPLTGAIENTLNDLLLIIRGVFLGLSEDKRQFYMLPVVSGALGLMGILLYPRKERSIRIAECWFWLSAGAAILLIASSQWQGVSNDRYLAWIFVIWMIYVAIGLEQVQLRLQSRYLMPICCTLLIGYQFITLAYMGSVTYDSAVSLEQQKQFATKVTQRYPRETQFGDTSGGGMNYLMPGYKVYNISGITSPDFFVADGGQKLYRIVDILKYNPAARFDYWLTSPCFIDNAPWTTPLMGDLEFQNRDMALYSEFATGVYPANWSTLDGGERPVLCADQLEGLSLLGKLDIAYSPHELEYDYQINLRLKNTTLTPVIKTDTLGDADYSEAGKLVLGSESFTVRHAAPNESLSLVLRTGISAEGDIYFGRQHSKIKNLELNETIVLRLFVNGSEVPVEPLPLNKKGFSEVVMSIPSNFIDSETLQIKVLGDHVSYAYWFYQ